MNLAFALAASYLLGGIPFAVLAARIKGVNLLEEGSRNPGATNAIRVLGPGLGVPVLLLDVAKGLVAVLAGGRLAGGGESAALACGAAAILGHVFPPALGFRGGKGVATAAGAFVALAPAATGAAVAVFALVLVAFRYVSAASMTAAVTLPLALWRFHASGVLLVAGVVVAALVVLRHRANLARLAAGTESRVRFGSRKGAAS